MKETRKLSTIIFADIAGYTATMQEDEQKALSYLNGFKKVLHEETEKYDGRIVQFFGDGCLLTFDSITSAVYCAIELQKKFIDNDSIPVRIGIHSGEVIFKENNVFGDGVNIASRIESLGIPGAILVSKVIRDQLKNKGDVLLVSLGTFLFKNVTEPMEVFAVANSGFVVPKRGEMQGKLQKGNSVKKKVLLPLIVLATLFLGYFVWTNFFSNDNATKIYEVKSTIVIDEETIEYNALVKLLFNENKATGVYINDIGERGIINGKLNNTSLDLTFNSILFAGECEFIGIIEEDKSAFKGKYSCTYDEFASTNAKEVSEANFALFTEKDSIYFMEN